jgi:hypothetical protein
MKAAGPTVQSSKQPDSLLFVVVALRRLVARAEYLRLEIPSQYQDLTAEQSEIPLRRCLLVLWRHEVRYYPYRTRRMTHRSKGKHPARRICSTSSLFDFFVLVGLTERNNLTVDCFCENTNDLLRYSAVRFFCPLF